MNKVLKDIKRYYPNKSIIIAIPLLILNPGFMAVLLYRVANFLYKCKLSILSKIIMFCVRIIYSIEIGYTAEIGEGFRLTHGSGTVIGGLTKIGTNVTILHQVTLGTNFKKKRYVDGKYIYQPIIKDNCMILAGAKIVGPVIVGERCIVGANSVLTQDTEPGYIYAGIPAKKVCKNDRY